MSEPQTHTAVTVYLVILQHCINCWGRPQKCLTEEPMFSVGLKPGTLCNLLLHQLRCSISWIRKNTVLNLQVSMSMPWRNIGGVAVQFQSFLTLGLDEGQKQTSSPSHLMSEERALWNPLNMKLGEHQSQSECFGKETILLPLPWIKPWIGQHIA